MGVKRESKFEMLRLIGALAITFNHVPYSENALSVNMYIQRFFFLGGQFGVNLYVILGAWFLSNKGFKATRVIRLVMQMLFYSLFLDGVSLLLGSEFSVRIFLKSFSYWFNFGYVVMLLLIPLYNRMNDKLKWGIICIGGVLTATITIIGYINLDFILVRLALKGVIIGPVWFSYVYILISQIKKIDNHIHLKTQSWFLIFISCYSLMYIVLIKTGNPMIREVNSPICFLCSISVFYLFKGLSIKHIPLVNGFSKYTFAVYLLQTHMVFRNYIWKRLFRLAFVSEISYLYLIDAIVCTCTIFVMAVIVDEIRIRIEKTKPFVILTEWLCSLLDKFYISIGLENE